MWVRSTSEKRCTSCVSVPTRRHRKCFSSFRMAGFTALSEGTVRKKYGYFFLSARTGVVAAKESCENEKGHVYWGLAPSPSRQPFLTWDKIGVSLCVDAGA